MDQASKPSAPNYVADIDRAADLIEKPIAFSSSAAPAAASRRCRRRSPSASASPTSRWIASSSGCRAGSNAIEGRAARDHREPWSPASAGSWMEPIHRPSICGCRAPISSSGCACRAWSASGASSARWLQLVRPHPPGNGAGLPREARLGISALHLELRAEIRAADSSPASLSMAPMCPFCS